MLETIHVSTSPGSRARRGLRLVAAAVAVAALALGVTTPAHATGNPLPSVDPSPSAASIAVLVNKQRPLNPSQYYPPDLVNVRGTGQYLRAEAAASLNTLFNAASAAGKPLTIVSAFRSYQTQVSTYNYYVSQYGEAYASTISARPGYSEHQTGLAVDVGNTYNCGLSTCFGNTPEGQWVAANAWRFGFIVRYPNGYTGTTGYAYEPWHLRYVGFDVASDMRSRSIPTLEQYFAGNPARSASVKSGADILAVDGTGKLLVYRGAGGSLTAGGAVSNGWSGFREGHVVDWTGDGIYDIVAVAKDGALYLFRGAAGGAFAPAQRIGQGWTGLTLTIGRLRDGQRPGILAYNSAGNLYYYANTTGGVPAPAQLIGHGWKDASLTLTDFNGDGRADLLARTSAGTMVFYPGTGAGTLGSSKVVGSGWQGYTAIAADYGFSGPGTHGVMARRADGSLAYFGFRMGQWLPSRTVGSGWGSLNIFR